MDGSRQHAFAGWPRWGLFVIGRLRGAALTLRTIITIKGCVILHGVRILKLKKVVYRLCNNVTLCRVFGCVPHFQRVWHAPRAESWPLRSQLHYRCRSFDNALQRTIPPTVPAPTAQHLGQISHDQQKQKHMSHAMVTVSASIWKNLTLSISRIGVVLLAFPTSEERERQAKQRFKIVSGVDNTTATSNLISRRSQQAGSPPLRCNCIIHVTTSDNQRPHQHEHRDVLTKQLISAGTFRPPSPKPRTGCWPDARNKNRIH